MTIIASEKPPLGLNHRLLLSRLRVKILGRHEDIGPVRHPVGAGRDGKSYIKDFKSKIAGKTPQLFQIIAGTFRQLSHRHELSCLSLSKYLSLSQAVTRSSNRPLMKSGAGPSILEGAPFTRNNSKTDYLETSGMSAYSTKTKPDSLNFFRGYRESTIQIY